MVAIIKLRLKVEHTLIIIMEQEQLKVFIKIRPGTHHKKMME